MKKKTNIYIPTNRGTISVCSDRGEHIAEVDVCSLPDLIPYYWSKAKKYTVCYIERLMLHRVILGLGKGHNFQAEVDHINRNCLDNRLCNLRIVTRRENNFNRSLNRNNKSGLLGVSWMKSKQRWRATIFHHYKQIHLGLFDTKEAAYEARLKAEKIYGEPLIHGIVTRG